LGADFPELRAGGRKETARQAVTAEPLYPALPALAAAIQPLEDPGRLREDRGLSQVYEPAGEEPTRRVTYGVPKTHLPARTRGAHSA
jgi:hypothetical protein